MQFGVCPGGDTAEPWKHGLSHSPQVAPNPSSHACCPSWVQGRGLTPETGQGSVPSPPLPPLRPSKQPMGPPSGPWVTLWAPPELQGSRGPHPQQMSSPSVPKYTRMGSTKDRVADKAQCLWEGSREKAALELGVWTLVGRRGEPRRGGFSPRVSHGSFSRSPETTAHGGRRPHPQLPCALPAA